MAIKVNTWKNMFVSDDNYGGKRHLLRCTKSCQQHVLPAAEWIYVQWDVKHPEDLLRALLISELPPTQNRSDTKSI